MADGMEVQVEEPQLTDEAVLAATDESVYEALGELLMSPGWALVRKVIEHRIGVRNQGLHSRARTKTMEDVRAHQEVVAELKFVLEAPQRMIKRLTP